MESQWYNRWAPSMAHTPEELEILAYEHDPWLNRGQPKLKSSEAKGSISNQFKVPFQSYENQQVPYQNFLNRNQMSRFLNQAQVVPSSIPYRNNQGLSFDARRYEPRRRHDYSGMDRSHFVREYAPPQRIGKMHLGREQLGQNCLTMRQQSIPKPWDYGSVIAQHQQESWKERELMSRKRDHNVPRFVAGSLYKPTYVDYNDASLPISSSVPLRSPTKFSRRSTSPYVASSSKFSRRSRSPYVASSSRSVEAVASSSNSVTHDQQHTLLDNFEAFSTVNDLEQNIRELSDFLGLPDGSRVETLDNNAGELNDEVSNFILNSPMTETFDNNAGELNDDVSDFILNSPMTETFDNNAEEMNDGVSDFILNSPMTENITVDCSNSNTYETNQNQINIENNNALNQDEFAHNNDDANNSSSAEFFPSCVGDELASLWGISCDP